MEIKQTFWTVHGQASKMIYTRSRILMQENYKLFCIKIRENTNKAIFPIPLLYSLSAALDLDLGYFLIKSLSISWVIFLVVALIF